jgi:hypothetical protein
MIVALGKCGHFQVGIDPENLAHVEQTIGMDGTDVGHDVSLLGFQVPAQRAATRMQHRNHDMRNV